VCEALALAGRFRVGQRVALGQGLSARIVGTGFVRRAALPLDSESLPHTPDISSRTLLVRRLGPLRVLAKDTGASVVRTAPLEIGAVHASELRTLSNRLAEDAVRLRRSTVRMNVTAPFELLDEIADRGDVAQIRLLLVAGQGAALVLAFAAYCAAARRRDSELADEQLETLGASRSQRWLTRVVEAALPFADRFPAFGLELLVRAELVRPHRTNPVKTQSRRTEPASDPTSYVLTSRGAEAIGLDPHTTHSD
jgi:hypothetical protein